MLTFENKAAKVKLNDSVHKLSVDEVIEQIDKVYGMTAVDACYSFGEVTASADGAVDTLEIEIHSAGGSVFDGYRIYNSMRELSARGFHDRETLIQAAVDALGGDDGERIARKVYRANFDTMEAN